MNTFDTIEVAALLAAHGDVFVEAPQSDPDTIAFTWRLLRERTDDWGARFLVASRSSEPDAVDAVLALAREVLVSDVLARTWCVLIAARSRRLGELPLEALARNALLGRLRSRRQALEWLLDDPRAASGGGETGLAAVDRLRRRCERWTDLLVARHATRFDLVEYGFDPERLVDFAAETGRDARSGAWPLLLAGLHAAFGDLPPDDEPARIENARLVSAILACLPVDAFGGDGPLRSLRHVRIRRGEPSLPPMAAGRAAPRRVDHRHGGHR